MWRARSRLIRSSVVKDLCILVLGVVVGVCISHFTDIIGCTSHHNVDNSRQVSNIGNAMTHHQYSLSNKTQNQQHQQGRGGLPVHVKNRDEAHGNRPRPKFLKDELVIREPLYVGVVTAKSFLNTRAMDINGTWAHKLSKVDYFVGEGQGLHPLSVVSLKGVDDSYPPQKKVYRMLRYMHDNYIDKYNWFLRADDDAYIRVPELVKFLSSLDPGEPLYIGSPGLGKPEDLDRIKLLPHERYCMGGPGVIFSRAMLIQLAPFLDDCLENVVVSYNEDLEVGRCISRRLGIQCTWAYEMRKLFFMDYTKGEMFKDGDKVYRNKNFISSLTSHPFKNSDLLYQVHQFFIEMAIKENHESSLKLEKELSTIQKRTKRTKAFS